MRFGIIGLGRMGANIARAAIEHGHHVVGHDHDEQAMADLTAEGVEPARTVGDLTSVLPSPRAVFLYVPHGEPTGRRAATRARCWRPATSPSTAATRTGRTPSAAMPNSPSGGSASSTWAPAAASGARATAPASWPAATPRPTRSSRRCSSTSPTTNAPCSSSARRGPATSSSSSTTPSSSGWCRPRVARALRLLARPAGGVRQLEPRLGDPLVARRAHARRAPGASRPRPPLDLRRGHRRGQVGARVGDAPRHLLAP